MADLHRARRRSILAGRDASRAIIWIFLAAAFTWCAGTMAAAAADLYRAKVTVTGQGEANRIIGFAALPGGCPHQGIRRTETQW